MIKALDYEEPAEPAGRRPTTSSYDYVNDSMLVSLPDSGGDDPSRSGGGHGAAGCAAGSLGIAGWLRRVDEDWLSPLLGGEFHQQSDSEVCAPPSPKTTPSTLAFFLIASFSTFSYIGCESVLAGHRGHLATLTHLTTVATLTA